MTEIPGRFSRSLSALLLLPALAVSLILTACDQGSDAPTPPSDEPDPAEATTPAPAPESPPASEPEPEKPSPPQETAPRGALLEMKESADGKTITVTGHLSSEYQVRDLGDNLKYAFPELTIVNEVKFDPEAQEVVWGNRVTDLLIPLVTSVEEAYFHYDKGITTLGGKVESRAMIKQIEQVTSYVMEADDSKGITNKVEVKQP